MINEIHEGKRITFTNSGSAILSGAIVPVGERCGVALVDIAATSGTGTVSMEGTYLLPKDGDEAFTQGQRLFHDASDGTVTGTATGGNKWVGYAEEAATESSTTCRVTLSPLPKKAANVAYSAGTNLAALVVTATNVAASNFTAADPAQPTKAEIDTGIDTVVLAIETALDLKADNADVETLRTSIETRLDAIDTGIASILTSLKNAGLMSDS